MMVDRGNAFVFERITAKITTAVRNENASGSVPQHPGDRCGERSAVPSIPHAFLVVRSADSQVRLKENPV